MANQIGPVNAWLYSRLHGDSSLLALLAHPDSGHPGVYNKAIAPPLGTLRWSDLYAAVVFQALATPYNRALGPQRLTHRWTYLVKAIGQGRGEAALDAIVDRLDVLLQSPPGQHYTGVVHTADALEGVDYAETAADGTEYRHRGARWALWVLPA